MVKPVFRQGLLAVIACAVIVASLSIPAALCQDRAAGEAGYYNQRGLEYFKKGFYDHTPKGRAAEARKNYGFAVKEFKAAISRDSSFTDAHRNLARVYYVQKNFEAAAEEYKRVTELVPSDLDAYVSLALALIELEKPGEAVQTLERAKEETSDPKALDTLDTYIAKVRAHQAKEVR